MFPEGLFWNHFLIKDGNGSSKNFMFAIYLAPHGGRATADNLYHNWGFNAAFDPYWEFVLAYEFTSLQTHFVYFFFRCKYTKCFYDIFMAPKWIQNSSWTTVVFFGGFDAFYFLGNLCKKMPSNAFEVVNILLNSLISCTHTHTTTSKDVRCGLWVLWEIVFEYT